MAKLDINSLPIGIFRVDTSLYIRKRPPPRKATWLYIFYLQGKRREISIGLCANVTMTAAKQRIVRLKALVDRGVDPVEERRNLRKAAKTNNEPFTFNQLLAEAMPIIARTKQWRNKKSYSDWICSIQTYASPTLGNMEVNKIKRDDILSVLLPIWSKKSVLAMRLRGRLEALFSYAIATGRFTQMNPCVWRGNLSLFLPPSTRLVAVKHHESLTTSETQKLLRDICFNDDFGAWPAIAFCILTASRVNEVVGARWDEINFSTATWLCPRRKDGKPYPHRVPLSEQSIELLHLLPRRSEFIFPSLIKAGVPIHKETLRSNLIRGFGRGTMHGFRSTFRDWCAETGKDRVLAEKSLMHATGSEVEQAYQRSDLLEQRRPLMQAWADTILPMDTLKEVLPESMNTPFRKY